MATAKMKKIKTPTGWTLIVQDKTLIVEPPLELKCPFCQDIMILHHVGSVHEPGHYSGFAIDLFYKCPTCSFFCVFGVPLTKEQANYLKNYHHQKGLDYNQYKLAERLKNLGYW